MNEAATETQSINTSGVPRKCVACGYNLTGLGEEPRCPECGLLNIPDGYRKQVWELVDSGKWFFSPMFGPFQKRLPGWWWALDRPGDVKRSARFAAWHLAIALALVTVTAVASTAIAFEKREQYTSYKLSDPITPHYEAHLTWRIGGMFGGSSGEAYPETIDYKQLYDSRRLRLRQRFDTRFVLQAPSVELEPLVTLIICLILIWAAPAFVGICTQLRKDLPSFARAPRTILAGANYESHRLIYVAIIFTLLVFAEVLARSQTFSISRGALLYDWGLLGGGAALALFGAVGWIGPVRSDYTNQLVRSRLHAARIVLMYGLAIPWSLLWFPVLAWWFIVG